MNVMACGVVAGFFHMQTNDRERECIKSMNLKLSLDIMDICNMEPDGITVEDCAERLHLAGGELSELFETFDEMIRRGSLVRISEERYGASKRAQEIVGIYKGYTPTFGFVLCENMQDDIYIAEQYRHTAMNNDKVAVRIIQSGRGRHKTEGEIIRIVERANKTLVGTFEREKQCGFVRPDDERIREDIYIPLDKTAGARSSARVLVNGMHAVAYAPYASTTRAQLWTILARQNNADLNGGNTWYEKAQLWSKDKGVSDGANPNAAINRAQMVTMLWRAVGQPTAGGTANFTDVPTDSYYAQAVAWAVENGITTGVGNGHFDPTGTCTRAQIAAFLARSMK